MIAKVPDKRNDKKSSFRTLKEYITRRETNSETGEVVTVEAPTETNCLSLKTASAEMKAAADMNGRVKDPVYHAVISWKEGEHPSDKQMFEAGHAAMKAVGMDGHQYVFAIHRDTENWHLHMMVNRVHPETERTVYPDRDFFKLDKCMREIELLQGWAHDNGPYAVHERDGKMIVDWTKEEKESRKNLPTIPADMEATTGLESLYSYVMGEAKTEVLSLLKDDHGLSWKYLHYVLAKHGLTIQEKGQGLAIFDKTNPDQTPIKASAVHESLGKHRLEKKLGPYQPPKPDELITDIKRSYNKHRELQPKRDQGKRDQRREERAHARAELKDRYNLYKAQFKPAKTLDLALHKQKMADVVAQRKRVLASIARSGQAPIVKQALRSEANFNSAKAKELLKAELSAERKALKEDPANKLKSYQQWVGDRAQEGDVAAISQLRGFVYADKKKIKALELAEAGRESEDGFAGAIKLKRLDPLLPPRRLLDDITTQVDRRNGDVRYLLGRKLVFTDHGKHVTFNPAGAASDEAIRAGLLLAKEKFGDKLVINGSNEFKQRVVAVVIKNKIQVRFADPVLENMHQEALVERMAARLRAPHPLRPEPQQVPFAAPVVQSTTELPVPSLASLPPKKNLRYVGKITSEDEHFYYQDTGRAVLVHHLKSEMVAIRVLPALGAALDMKYGDNGKLLTAIPAKGRGSRGS